MVAILLMVLFQRFWRWLTVISRTKRLMMDVSSSAGEVVMLGAGSIEHRELVYYNIQKSTTFQPPRAGPRRARRRRRSSGAPSGDTTRARRTPRPTAYPLSIKYRKAYALP
jgi:hypothetical protein